MRARRMRVAREREPADDLAVDLGHEQRSRRDGAAARGCSAARRRRCASVESASSQPSGSAPTALRERDERRGVARLGGDGCATRHALDDDAGAAAARVARGRERAVRLDLDSGRAAEEQVPPPPAHDVVAHRLEPVELGGVVTRPRSGRAARRGGRAARRSRPRRGMPCSSTLTTICMIAPRSRAEPALPTTSRGRPVGGRARSTAPSCS